MEQIPSLKTYFLILVDSFSLLIKNLLAFVFLSLYSVIFYLGFFFYFNKQYFFSVLLFIAFMFCISSTFYITSQIVKDGHFRLFDLPKSFLFYFFRANFIFAFWFAIFFFINQFIITPVSSVLQGDLLLYLVIVPAALAVFFVFNSLPELIYSSQENIESIIISSINFFEKHWLSWITPTVIIMFLLNLFDHRLSIMPTLGFMDPQNILAKIQDIAFYIRSFIFTFALIFRGLLFKVLFISSKEKIA